ncbi:hypothetical protein HNY73_011674 [Argiope bruennichi]|uniref:Uncharacterized protein n=1 Tax=Argiope bruennichi TaxID=94029 RepID=A0A8T0F3W3_ARGBR|nr:hypothetical protein HNY73_011674 [Argiope bruennichi]
MGKRSYNTIHAIYCKEQFLQKNRYVDSEELDMEHRIKCLKFEIAYLECKKENMDLKEAYEELQKECEKLRTNLTLSDTMECFDIRSTQLGCGVNPCLISDCGWHLSSCVYPDKKDCSCKFHLSHPTRYFLREKTLVNNVLNRGLHWDYCPLSKIACEDLIMLNTSRPFECECRIAMNSVKDEKKIVSGEYKRPARVAVLFTLLEDMDSYNTQYDWTPVMCSRCQQLMFFKDFYLHHVHQVHGVENRCPFCFGEHEYTIEHATDCWRLFLLAHFYEMPSYPRGWKETRIWEKRVLRHRRNYLQVEIDMMEARKKQLEKEKVKVKRLLNHKFGEKRRRHRTM